MASMLPIPYARQQPYDNSQYVRAMADLMLRRGDVASAAALARGQNTQQMADRLGNITMATFAGIGQQRDEERDRAMRQATLDREYALKQQEMQDRAEERAAEQAYRRRQEEAAAETRRASGAKEFTENVSVGTVVPRDQFGRMISGTPSVSAYENEPGMAARLPATPMIESGGIPASPDAQGMHQTIFPERRTMSPDTAAVPEGMRRIASQPERVQLANLQRQQDANDLQRENIRIDNARQQQALRAQMENTAADNLRADEARKDRAALARDMMETRRFIAGAAQDQRALQNMFTLSGQVKSHPAYTKMLDFESGLQAVETGLQQNNGLGDIAAINAFQRLVDPGVSVREGDVKLLENAIALGSRLDPSFWIDKLKKGDRLPADMRQAMQKAARELYVTRTKTYNETVGDTFRQQADAAKIPFSLIGRDFQIPDFSKPFGGADGGTGSFFGDPARQPKK